MAVTREEVLRVAALARLRLEPREVERMTAQLNAILDHADALGAGDAGAVDEGDDAAAPPPLRADEPPADPLAFGPERLAPAWADGFFTVPRLSAHEGQETRDAGSSPDGGRGDRDP